MTNDTGTAAAGPAAGSTGGALVAGVDSSTQSCKVVVCDAATGVVVRSGSARHPDGTEAPPQAWWDAFQEAARAAGGLEDVAALAVGGQQHGMVCLDEAGEVVRPALLWNDTRSAPQADALVAELGGPKAWADAVGSVPVASFTVTKLRWLAEHEPENARRTAAVCLPHDYLSWRLRGGPSLDGHGLDALVTDRGDASGTGYWSPRDEAYWEDLFQVALGHSAVLPRVAEPGERIGTADPAALAGTGARAGGGTAAGELVLGPGTGDNMAAALGLGLGPGDVVVSLGTSGTAFASAAHPTADASGAVAGFADAQGRFLPLVCTLNAARVLDAAAAMLGVTPDEFDKLALSAPGGAGGLTLIPYLEGERTPNRPDASGELHGLRLANSTPQHLARAAVEGMLCGMADALDALTGLGVPAERVLLIGGGARSEAVRRIAPAVLGRPVVVPSPAEYVALGAARQAAWVLGGGAEPPTWSDASAQTYEAEPDTALRARYAELRR